VRYPFGSLSINIEFRGDLRVAHWKLAGLLVIVLLGGCASSGKPKPMTEAEGRIRYPVQITVVPPGRTAYQESLDLQACTSHGPERTKAMDQRFLSCMGNKGYRLKIYRPGYFLSNISQPVPAAGRQ
jgi:hypothetical protein